MGLRVRRAPERLAVAVFLAASLAACFDSRRIIFTHEDLLPDAGAGGAPPAPQSQAAGVEPAAVSLPSSERAAEPGVLEATAPSAGDGARFDAGAAPAAIDAGAPDAAP